MAEMVVRRIDAQSVPRVRLVKGSHIVVRRPFDHDKAAIPYERDSIYRQYHEP